MRVLSLLRLVQKGLDETDHVSWPVASGRAGWRLLPLEKLHSIQRDARYERDTSRRARRLAAAILAGFSWSKLPPAPISRQTSAGPAIYLRMAHGTGSSILNVLNAYTLPRLPGRPAVLFRRSKRR